MGKQGALSTGRWLGDRTLSNSEQRFQPAGWQAIRQPDLSLNCRSIVFCNIKNAA